MTLMKTERVWFLIAATAVCLSLFLDCGGARALDREPETAKRCICIGGATVEWLDGSTIGPPGHGRLDWPGASSILRCRPERLPIGVPGE
ncbi:MAG: hypothetical protein JRF63_13170 [Deltaproteobacteria bacterium]|nr:hypothetical protein [Deltaproteobacteria bacterium]